MVYFDLRHRHALALSPSLKELHDNASQDGYLTDNYRKLVEMQAIHSLLALHADFSFQAPPTFGSKWSVFFHLCVFGKCINASPLVGRRPHSFCLSYIWFILCLGGFGYKVQKVHGFIWVLARKVTSTHGFQQLLHGWRHTIIEMIHIHPCIKTMVWTCTDGLHEPLPTLKKLLIIVGRVSVYLPLQIVGFGCTENFFKNSA